MIPSDQGATAKLKRFLTACLANALQQRPTDADGRTPSPPRVDVPGFTCIEFDHNGRTYRVTIALEAVDTA